MHTPLPLSLFLSLSLSLSLLVGSKHLLAYDLFMWGAHEKLGMV